ncbi:PREDICTED: NACHT, LRR and PYD domains-containing protein 7-like, partial [Acropora digitifera]|uniref:NACHT, LRR and PYD domains-containing protein 7-like n=1 Tax=Acropora digitifera TaxID=70779 RepID=UPI000779FCFA
MLTEFFVFLCEENQERSNIELGEVKENQERTNIELGEVKEMVKQLQPCERSNKESLKDEQGVKHNGAASVYFERNHNHVPVAQLQHLSIIALFLIEGQPGMGKTTYCHKIAYDWAKKRKGCESFPDVTLVLLLKCRDINCGLWEAIDDQLLPREMKEEEKERFFTFIREHQSKVLLLLDGLDELPRDHLLIYKDIIQGGVLPDSYIVVTAQHEVGVIVRECCHTLLEVEGFTETDVEEFILKYFEEEHLAEKLLNKLDTDETLQDLTRNPLNTALLCLLFEDFGGKFPESRTLLYLEIVKCVLRRYRRKMKLPETNQDLLVLYKIDLKLLGLIAMEGLHNDSMYFDESAFEVFSSNVISGLGFLSVEAGRSKRRPRRSYGFLHKSFQKFFAALFHCCQLLDGEMSVDSFLADRRYFHEFDEVLTFTCGLLAQKCEAAAKALIAGIATRVNLDDCRLDVALASINECKREGNSFHKQMASFLAHSSNFRWLFAQGLDESVSFKPGALSQHDVLGIAHELSSSWKIVGRVLNVPDAVIYQIQADESTVSEKCYSVLRYWQGSYPSDATYHHLARALQHPTVDRVDVAFMYCGPQFGRKVEGAKDEAASVPAEIRARGSEAKRAFQKAMKSGKVRVYRGRIMLLGQDRAGKTSLKKS